MKRQLTPAERDLSDMRRKFSLYQARMRANPTKGESAVKSALDNLGIRYTFQKGFLRGKTLRIVDFYITKPKRICIEVDGKYHEKQREYDAYREREIKSQRNSPTRFLRITNEWALEQVDLPTALNELLK